MPDLLAAFGLAIALEGLLFAAFPGFVRKRMQDALMLKPATMRVVGLAGAAAGVGIVALARALLGSFT